MIKCILLHSITLYQKLLSPYMGGNCRFYPSCSDYAIRSIEQDGVLKGSFKSAWRVLRCNPLSEGGVDLP